MRAFLAGRGPAVPADAGNVAMPDEAQLDTSLDLAPTAVSSIMGAVPAGVLLDEIWNSARALL